MRKLNLGAGDHILEDGFNVDLWVHRPEIDLAYDLNVLPWPWPDERWDLILARAILEHLMWDLYTTVNECWRILTVGGLLEIKLPYCKAERSWDDATHYHQVGRGVFDVLDDTRERSKYRRFYRDGFRQPLRPWRIELVTLNPGGTSVYWKLRKVAEDGRA